MSLISIKTPVTGPKYWRSLNELADTPAFQEWVHREFPANATEMLDSKSRRTVLKLMAASFGLAGLTACRRPVEHVLPYSKGVEDFIPGAKYMFSTVMSLGGQVTGLLVEAHDGRPTKIEGNPDHPSSLGAATAMQQAEILSLYDPDRSGHVLEGGKDSTWQKFEAAFKAINLGDGAGLRFLSEAVTSPSLAAQRAAVLAKFPKAKWVEYDPISRENLHSGTALAFGQPLDGHPHFDKAKVILSLDADFLGLGTTMPLATRLFSKGRKVASEEDLEKVNRLYTVESQFSLTGANADHRLRMRSGDVKQFAIDVASALGALPGLSVVGNTDKRGKFLAAVVKDLKAAGREALVLAGQRQPASVQALAHLINQALGSEAMSFTKPAGGTFEAGVEALRALTTEMSSGQVSTLVILGGNPVYTAPADLQFSAALAKVAASIHLGLDDDETAASAKWHLPEAHFLESWGDAMTSSGVASIQQPLIEPLHGGKTAAEIVALFNGEKSKDDKSKDEKSKDDKNKGDNNKKAYEIVKDFWTSQWPAAVREKNWRQSVHDGVIAAAKPSESVKASVDAKKVAAAVAAEPKASTGGLEVNFVPSSATWDGRYANNAWMQEAPDPMNKLVWGNAALISKATAEANHLADGDIVTLSRGGLKTEAAIMFQPGHADNSITISLGYGRTRCGRVGKDVGFNANLIRSTEGFWFASDFTVASTGKSHRHATTQERGMAEGMNNRPLYRETTLTQYKAKPKVIEEMSEVPEIHSIYPEVSYATGHQWGMAIDLNSCTGCNACVVACQAENNIVSVGRDQVLRGREMHWIRMDRYYVGPDDDPRAVEQPLPCMQCENAPCENVCPVAATSHSPEGLNDMAYNRCVGTRYCANNCPFKVRHFNFLNFHKNDPEIIGMAHNPDVTVRMRGVMEKCTYCVQRIQEARITAKTHGRKDIKEGDIQTACQQTCPAEAIVFGDINDPESKVTKLKKQERNYAMLAELGIKPRTTYLARLRNLNPELEA